MPTYEYQCQECAERFQRAEHIEDHETAHPECPKCGSAKVEQVYSTFFAKTARKS